MPKIMFMTTHDESVENIYTQIKDAAKAGELNSADVESIADLTTELANRLKVEENDQ